MDTTSKTLNFYRQVASGVDLNIRYEDKHNNWGQDLLDKIQELEDYIFYPHHEM